MRTEQSLNGIWDFEFSVKAPEQINLAELAFAERISVPGCFDALTKYAGKRGTGIYRRFVECGGTVRLNLEAVGLRAEVYWDRKKIGRTDLPYSPYTPVFDAGAQGRHELVIVTDNRQDSGTASLFHAYYDFYAYGGIYRNVSLTELPACRIDRAEFIPEDLEAGTVRIRLALGGEIPEQVTAEVRFDTSAEAEKITVHSGAAETVCRVPGFKLWSPESPELHTARIVIPGDTVTVEFGMRKIECRDGGFLLNGKPLKLIGWNRHESHPEFGAAVPEFLTCSDLRMIKEQGCNFIRGCHYKQSEAMLRLCDRMGLLVWEESLGWGNRPEQLADPEFRRLQREQTVAMVRSSINHPSVILWGFLNECASETQEARGCIAELASAIRAEDASRPVTFASNRGIKDICLDLVDVIAFNTYPGWYDHTEIESYGIDRVVPALETLAEFASRPEYRDKPLIISEIGAAAIIGDHSGLPWSEEYQAELLGAALNFTLTNPRCGGIAMWQFCNARTYTANSCVLTRPRGFNNKGAVDEYRRPKLAWHRIRQMLTDAR